MHSARSSYSYMVRAPRVHCHLGPETCSGATMDRDRDIGETEREREEKRIPITSLSPVPSNSGCPTQCSLSPRMARSCCMGPSSSLFLFFSSLLLYPHTCWLPRAAMFVSRDNTLATAHAKWIRLPYLHARTEYLEELPWYLPLTTY